MKSKAYSFDYEECDTWVRSKKITIINYDWIVSYEIKKNYRYYIKNCWFFYVKKKYLVNLKIDLYGNVEVDLIIL